MEVKGFSQKTAGLSSMETWCGCWNVKIYKKENQDVYFSHRYWQPEPSVTLNNAKDFDVIFDKKITRS
jgi:hypothetical protein